MHLGRRRIDCGPFDRQLSPETSWSLSDDNGAVVAAGLTKRPPWKKSRYSVWNQGCYSFTVNDSYGDSICCAYGNGSYTLTLRQRFGQRAATLPIPKPPSFASKVALVARTPIRATMKPNATTDDGSCEYNSCLGCTDQAAIRYDANAALDDGTCVFPYDVVYIDEDGDAAMGAPVADWCPPLESWTVFQSGDCNDGNAAIHPNAPGTGEGIDNNCNGVIDPAEQVPAPCRGCERRWDRIRCRCVGSVVKNLGASSCEYDVTGDGNVNVCRCTTIAVRLWYELPIMTP